MGRISAPPCAKESADNNEIEKLKSCGKIKERKESVIIIPFEIAVEEKVGSAGKN